MHSSHIIQSTHLNATGLSIRRLPSRREPVAPFEAVTAYLLTGLFATVPAGVNDRARLKSGPCRRLGMAMACVASIGLAACGGGESAAPEAVPETLASTVAESAHDSAAQRMSHLSVQGAVAADSTQDGAAQLGAEEAPEVIEPAASSTAQRLAAMGENDGGSATALAVSIPARRAFVERVELIANDGMSQSQPLPNHWGLHQPRVTVHTDGTVRALYTRIGANGMANWRLMRRHAQAGAWTVEASGNSQDDVTLMRDPSSDLAHVVAWPNSIPTVFSSPFFAPQPIPGAWQVLGVGSRHYGNSGLGSDGLLCLKATVELRALFVTSNTLLQLTCGRYNPLSRTWRWNTPLTKAVGTRKAYDYVLPGAFGAANQLVAAAQIDVHKSVLGLNQLLVSQGNYVFNGVSDYVIDVGTGAGWLQGSLVAPIYAPTTATRAPMLRQIDAYADSSARLFSVYFHSDPLQPLNSGLYLNVSNARGVRLAGGRITELPRYGFARVFEDAQKRMWLLWTNLGSQLTQVTLYRLEVQGTAVVLTSPTDLSAAFAPYAIEGAPFLAVPRGGQLRGDSISGIMIACDGMFRASKLASCYPTAPNRQKVLAFKLQLPA